MRSRLGAVLLGAAALGLAACDEGRQSRVVSTPSQACDTSFRILNNSSVTVQEFYFGSSAQRVWGNDQLGANVLPPGRATAYRARYTGNYDFRVVWTNGQAAELMGVNICRMNQITVTNRGLIPS